MDDEPKAGTFVGALGPGEAEELDSAIPGWREMTLAEFAEAKLAWVDGQLDLINDLRRLRDGDGKRPE